jgi:DNA-binding response OmpR family regulator
MDGIEIAKKLREESVFTPILMLTARTQQKDIWEGFENGTDDYVTKPFDFKELVLRINSLIKRNSRNHDEVLKVDDVILNPKILEVKKAGVTVKLNNKEFGILEYLIRNRGKPVNAEELLEHVWDEEIDIFTQTVRTNIKTLRQKIDPKKKIISTIRGKGYVIR